MDVIKRKTIIMRKYIYNIEYGNKTPNIYNVLNTPQPKNQGEKFQWNDLREFVLDVLYETNQLKRADYVNKQ